MRKVHLQRISSAIAITLIVTQETLTLAKGATYNPQITAIDAVDGPVSVMRVSNVNTKRRGTYSDKIEATDASGNTRRIERTIIVQ